METFVQFFYFDNFETSWNWTKIANSVLMSGLVANEIISAVGFAKWEYEFYTNKMIGISLLIFSSSRVIFFSNTIVAFFAFVFVSYIFGVFFFINFFIFLNFNNIFVDSTSSNFG